MPAQSPLMTETMVPTSSSSSSLYRHDPYAISLLPDKDRLLAVESFGRVYLKARDVASDESKSPSTPLPTEEAKRCSFTVESCNDDGVSEVSSEYGSGHNSQGAKDLNAACGASSAVEPPLNPVRYASVNFRFGSAWFVAPFRTFVGDMVVVQYPGNNNSLHMGLVSSITTIKPQTFYTETNMDPNYLSSEELATLPHLLRHARDFDKEAKLDMRTHDLNSLNNARKLAEELAAPVTFLDAEWLLDLSAITFLVSVYGDSSRVDQLADELASQEGAEVVFTYPVGRSVY